MQGSKDDSRGKTWTRRERQARSRSESRRTIAEGRGKNEESKDEREELQREAIKAVPAGRDGREKGQPLGEKREDRRE